MHRGFGQDEMSQMRTNNKTRERKDKTASEMWTMSWLERILWWWRD